MDVTMPLPDHVWVEDAQGNVFQQDVLYDWKPSYCQICNMPGHDCNKVAPTVRNPPKAKALPKTKKSVGS